MKELQLKKILYFYLLCCKHYRVNTTYSTVNAISFCAITAFICWFLQKLSFFTPTWYQIPKRYPKELGFGHFKRNILKILRYHYRSRDALLILLISWRTKDEVLPIRLREEWWSRLATQSPTGNGCWPYQRIFCKCWDRTV